MEDTDWRALVASERAENQALRDKLKYFIKRNLALSSENRQRREYTNQLLRQVTWLVGELRKARTEERQVKERNRMVLRGLDNRQERERKLLEERDEALKLRDAAIRLLAESSISSTDKE